MTTIIYNAITNPRIIPLFFEKTGIKLNILIAYLYLAGTGYALVKLYRNMIEHLALDSSAYSVKSGKAKVTLSEYRHFTRRFGHLFDVFFSLDDDFENPYHNFVNQFYLTEGLPTDARKPVPVIHDPNDPYEEFSTYVKGGHDYIAIGSNKSIPDDVFQRIRDDYPDVKIHIFGKLNRRLLQKQKPYSADASTWTMEAGHGSFYFWDPEDQKEYRIYAGERDRKDKDVQTFKQFHHKDALEEFIKSSLGFTYQEVLTNPLAKPMLNLLFFHQLQENLSTKE